VTIRGYPDEAATSLREDRAAEGGEEMSTMSHEPAQVVHQPEMWASLAISVMWIAVFVTAIWGPDATFTSNDGSSSTIPTAVFVTVFAFLGSWIVAKYGFRQQRKD
jgi:membrane protein YdbS with pleckstrin-like domain